MDISITGHHVHISDGVRTHVNKRLKKVENHFRQPTNVDVVLHKEHDSFHSEATIHGKRMAIHASSRSSDLFSAIDAMTSKLDRQVIKHKERLTSHGKHGNRPLDVRY